MGETESRTMSLALTGSLQTCSRSLRSEDSLQQKLMPRETLFVSSSGLHAEGNDSEWIVSYSSGSKTSDLRPNAKGMIESRASEVDDVYMVVQPDAFNMARILISRLLSSSVGEHGRIVRLFCSLDQPESVHRALTCILLVSNVMKLSSFVIKKSPESADMIFVIHQAERTLSSSSRAVPPLDLSESVLDDVSEVASSLFTRLYTENASTGLKLELVEDRDIMSVLRAVSVICFEAVSPEFESIPPILRLEIEPSSSRSRVEIVVSKVDLRTTSVVSDVVKQTVLPDFPTFGEFISHVNSLEGSTVLLQVPAEDVAKTANAVLRVFMAGYCSVELEDLEEEEEVIANVYLPELVLLVVKYFEVLLEKSSSGGRWRLTRKSSTVDPFVQINSNNLIREIDSGGEEKMVATVLQALSSGPVSVSISRSVQTLHKLISYSMLAGQMKFQMFCRDASVVVVRIVPNGGDKIQLVENILAKLSVNNNNNHPGDVSPSNYKPVDATLRYGSDSEVADFKEKLSVLKEGRRLSVLLVGPKNIGLGIRLLSSPTGCYEFVSERAVRDAEGASLKCAVRLFIKRESAPFSSSLENCQTVRVSETDSRITIANELFTLLNEAPNGYVLIKAETDYCCFIAAMSVVVANGWSRSIHQRVETRAVVQRDDEGENRDDEERVVYFITRLIVNTV